jgi:hypothetical protein
MDKALLGTEEKRMEVMLVWEQNLLSSCPLSYLELLAARIYRIYLEIFPMSSAYR